MQPKVPLTVLGFAFTVCASWWDVAFFNDINCTFTEAFYINSGTEPTAQCLEVVGGSPLSVTFDSDEFWLNVYSDKQCTEYCTSYFYGCMNYTFPEIVNLPPFPDGMQSYNVVRPTFPITLPPTQATATPS